MIYMHNSIHNGDSERLLLIRMRMLLFPDRIHLLELQNHIIIILNGVLKSMYGQNNLVSAGGKSGVNSY